VGQITGAALNANYSSTGVGGTLSSGICTFINGNIAVSSGCTVSGIVGLLFSDAIGAGTVTEQVVVDTPTLVKGATNIAVRSAIVSGANNYFLRSTGTAQSAFAGLFTQYNGTTLVAKGVPHVVAVINSTGLSSDVAATLLYAVPAAKGGAYRISWCAAITTVGGTSSTLGGDGEGFRIDYTDFDTGVDKLTPLAATVTAAPTEGVDVAYMQTNKFNAIGTQISGVIVIHAAASTNINYRCGYTSTGTAMVFNLHVTCEAM